MILFELMQWLIKKIFYYIARPIIWIITARDCRHCKYGGWMSNSRWYGDPFGWYCDRTYNPDIRACQKTPWRCKFERRERR